jgi:hypothetical protein
MKILMQALHVFFPSQRTMIIHVYYSMLEYKKPQGDCILHEQFP